MAPGAMIQGGGRNVPHRLRGLRQPLVPLLLLLLLLPLLLLPWASAFLHPLQPAPTTHTGRRQPPPTAPSFTSGGGVPSLVRQWSSPLQHSSSHASPGSSAVALQDMVATLERDGRFTRLVGLIKAAGMEGTLQSEGPWTLLAPTDAVLDDAGFNLTLSVAGREPARHLGRILAYHVIPGKRAGLSEFVNSGDSRSRVKTLERSGLSVAVYGGSILVDDTKILEWGLEASNGVIHVLDGLLQPVIPGFDPFAEDQDQAEGPVPGVTPPLGFFDPLGFWDGKGEAEQARLRRAELTHGRLAMLAAVGVIGQELLSPGQSATAALTSTSLPPLGLPGWAAALLALAPGAAYEGYEQLTGGATAGGGGNRRTTEFLTQILEQESPDFEAERAARRARRKMESRELNNGRLAMVAVLGMLAQEVVTGGGLF